ncbi:MAG: molybdopterin-dependent oxidoreductase, partial [Acidobacteria bacterium]|nr:molybdopterin-dependent oxidoreductase [Acidobacteriota bacterium]
MKIESGIGQSIPRIEGEDKVTGRLPYLGDLQISGMLHGKILRSGHAHAKIRGIDASRAAKLPGVVAVLTRDDVIGNPRYHSHYGPVLKDQPIVALDRVRYVGDPVAAVAATGPEVAEEALELIAVDYEELPEVTDPEEALAEDAPLLHEKMELPRQGFVDLRDVAPQEGTNICNRFQLKKGDVEKGFAESDHVFEDVFNSPATQHAALETHIAIAQF